MRLQMVRSQLLRSEFLIPMRGNEVGGVGYLGFITYKIPNPHEG